MAVRRITGEQAEVSGFQARIQAGRRQRAQRKTDGGAVQAVLESSGFHCRSRAGNAANCERRETSHCHLSQSGHLPLQCFVPNTPRMTRLVLVSSARCQLAAASFKRVGNATLSGCKEGGKHHLAAGSCKNATKLGTQVRRTQAKNSSASQQFKSPFIVARF